MMKIQSGRATGPTLVDTVRDHLANERTLLAWSRTSIAIIGLGFVVARVATMVAPTFFHMPQELTPLRLLLMS
jgi:uncharacterized membrane protein YidH (DUF202 family)